MPTHGPDELAKASRQVRRLTRASLMSDTRWRRVFTALDRPEFGILVCVWRLVGLDHDVPGHVPRIAHLYLRRPWIDTLDFGPIPIRSIERLLIPRHGRSAAHPQNVDAAALALRGLGRLPITLCDEGLIIDGHLPIAR